MAAVMRESTSRARNTGKENTHGGTEATTREIGSKIKSQVLESMYGPTDEGISATG